MRLAKFLANGGVASRRAAEGQIADGRVTVAGEIVRDPARGVDGSEPVAVDGRPLALPADRGVYAVQKPAGGGSTPPATPGRPTPGGPVPAPRRPYPPGPPRPPPPRPLPLP